MSQLWNQFSQKVFHLILYHNELFHLFVHFSHLRLISYVTGPVHTSSEMHLFYKQI